MGLHGPADRESRLLVQSLRRQVARFHQKCGQVRRAADQVHRLLAKNSHMELLALRRLIQREELRIQRSLLRART